MNKEIFDFLNHSSYKGLAWLTTPDGRLFLKSFFAIPWLTSQEGMNWLESQKGKQWLSEPHLELDKFFSESKESLMLLQLDSVQGWLLTERGKHWLVTGQGYDWLCTPDGHNWLKKPDGKKWLGVPDALLDLINK